MNRQIQEPDNNDYVAFLHDANKSNKYLEENFGKLPEEYQQLVKSIGDRGLGPSYNGFQLLSIAVWLRKEQQYTAIDYWQGTSNLSIYYKSNALNELIKKRDQLQAQIQEPDNNDYVAFWHDVNKRDKYLEENFGKLPVEYKQLVRNIGDRNLGPSYDGFQLLSLAVWLRKEQQYTAIDYWQGTSNLYSYYNSNVLNELIKKRDQLQTKDPQAPIIKTNDFHYVKLVINNISQGDLYLCEYRSPDLSIIQPTIIKNTSATYICKSETFRRLSAPMKFWSAKDLYTTSWSASAFCISINNDDQSRLLVYECAKNDSLDDLTNKKVGKEILNLTNGTTYNGFFNSWIYASVTADSGRNVEINIQIGGNPFSF
ncbi:15805_t:CDS:1 [Cetraspora pellucida]|uniref:15805_t:CDS:1 n=1 Tax=Cetraspora pellucida TaxID=1433469 RepID=A0A9N9AQJ4_9GLOM|nr:15805_t:CDS:1 [Cetraspora pellucida]